MGFFSPLNRSSSKRTSIAKELPLTVPGALSGSVFGMVSAMVIFTFECYKKGGLDFMIKVIMVSLGR